MQPLDAPLPCADWALFLDVDGTLIDIAARPDRVSVPEGLPATLNRVKDRLGGALALISGRPLDDIDRLMAPYRLPCAAEHGAILRWGDGTVRSQGDRYVVQEKLREELREAARSWPGTIVEEKRYNVVVHYRQSPFCHGAVRDFTRSLAIKAGPEFEVLPARMAFEIRHRALNKGHAVNAFLAEPPFHSRRPVFVGDDVTDEDGFRMAVALGGIGIDVRVVFAGEPSRVRAWLESFESQLPS
jgi:trehalose 6-phosphate phosphatase